jgi:putative lipoprotein
MTWKTVVVALFLWAAVPGAVSAQTPQTAPRLDAGSRWFGEDKVKHFFASFVVSSIAASAGRAAGLSRDESLAVGAGIGAAAGLIKEGRDARNGGMFSIGDLVWDAAGLGAAYLLLQQTE